MELRANLVAAYASAGRAAELQERAIPVGFSVLCMDDFSRLLTLESQKEEDSFEVAFNKSFIAIQSGDWVTAAEQLSLAESMIILRAELIQTLQTNSHSSTAELCRETFEAEGVSAAEIEEEVSTIKIQLAFVKQMQGDMDGALSDYRNILKTKYAPRLCLLT